MNLHNYNIFLILTKFEGNDTLTTIEYRIPLSSTINDSLYDLENVLFIANHSINKTTENKVIGVYNIIYRFKYIINLSPYFLSSTFFSNLDYQKDLNAYIVSNNTKLTDLKVNLDVNLRLISFDAIINLYKKIILKNITQNLEISTLRYTQENNKTPIQIVRKTIKISKREISKNSRKK